MPNQPLVKLCGTCRRVTVARRTTRTNRCWSRPLEGGPQCGSYGVSVLTLRQLGDLVFRNEARDANVQAQLDELGEAVRDLQLQVRLQQTTIENLRRRS